jgi:hypothetical protein
MHTESICLLCAVENIVLPGSSSTWYNNKGRYLVNICKLMNLRVKGGGGIREEEGMHLWER